MAREAAHSIVVRLVLIGDTEARYGTARHGLLMIWDWADNLLRYLILSLIRALIEPLVGNLGAESLLGCRIAIEVDDFFTHDYCIFIFTLWLLFIFSLLEVLIVTINFFRLVLFVYVSIQGLLRACIFDALDGDVGRRALLAALVYLLIVKMLLRG